MVVDDHPMWRDAVERDLASAGFEVATPVGAHHLHGDGARRLVPGDAVVRADGEVEIDRVLEDDGGRGERRGRLRRRLDNLDRLDLSKPTLSGFESARPEAESRWTEMAGRNTAHDLYRHPMLQQEGFGWDSSNSETARISFNKSFDVYSLGIVLLEIACWKPIHAILDINLEQAGLRDTMPVRRRLLEEPVHLARVRASVGDIMHAVIRACLEGLEQHGGSDLVDMNDPEYPLHFQEAFYEQVVRRLHTISI
jgi:hypothetical protein